MNLSCFGQSDTIDLKSITKTINDSILEIKEFGIHQNLIFEKHDQIDYGHENSIIFMTAFIKDTLNHQKIKYYANSRSGLKLTIDSLDVENSKKINKIGIYDEILSSESFRENLFKINSNEDFIRYFEENYPFEAEFDYVYVIDSLETKIDEYEEDGLFVTETVKLEDGSTSEYSKVYFNQNGKKKKEIVMGEYRKMIEYIYDKQERIVLQNEKGQHYQFYYKDDLLVKKEIYHGTALAFFSEYFYENGLLTKEVKHRKTDSKFFQKIPEKQTIDYRYEYY